ncbi:citrate lyase subunit beta [Streptomyces abyssalis]|uniref:Citrate lyase subunit beta n=1 Tax=Streptomyces abyssalis TaxID=933944 RepID=A0A1E7JM51_9ACTN|nr:CoA ester lyase [Streptomyces abyssalis]OEU88698.1 citrate lyase subunit beta [Streptomyces abyssalis]OEU91348.1 citrate lyase subunit beta [Streptomyces abyssalis]OEV30562.1 citrate lyase subunit beta [Streptomyces nanshensis]
MSPLPLTWLYAPGDRPDVVRKALTSGAHVVIVDLEDAVAPDRKEYALRATAELLADPRPGPVPVHVRVNALDGPLSAAEVRSLAALPGLAGLRLPKVDGAADVVRVARWARAVHAGDREAVPAAAGVPALYALLESALGIENAFTVATAHPAVRGIALGEADLRAVLGVTGEAGLAWPRSRAVVAAHAAGLDPPPQSVYPDVSDSEGLARSCAAGRSLGFLGRTAIHPCQLEIIERAYLPSPQEVEAAEEVLKAAATGAGALALPDGRFVDAAVVAGAQRTLALARRRP